MPTEIPTAKFSDWLEQHSEIFKPEFTESMRYSFVDYKFYDLTCPELGREGEPKNSSAREAQALRGAADDLDRLGAGGQGGDPGTGFVGRRR